MGEEFIIQQESKRIFEPRPLQIKDVPQVADLHALVFPDYFLTHMGNSFLIRFYKHFLPRPGIALVAFDGQQCVGFVAGTAQPEYFFTGFYRKNLLPIVLITLQQLILDGYIRTEISKRAGHVGTAFKAVFPKKAIKSATVGNHTGESSADLLGIGVHPIYRGKGIADALVRQFCDVLISEGIKTVSLTVRQNNFGAIGFYKKTGWQISGASKDSIYFSRSTDFS